MIEPSLLVEHLNKIATDAGDVIMRYYSDGVDVFVKSDNSPVTSADLAANDLIVAALRDMTPDIPIISEELSFEHNMEASQHEFYWLVDPLDGTKSFINKTGEFTVNIALMSNGDPISGVIYVPATGELYYVGEDGGAYRSVKGEAACKICVRDVPAEGLTAVASKAHANAQTESYITSLNNVVERISVSSSLKFCRVAEGKADIYPRFGRTMHWDTGAGHAILNAAGGCVVDEGGNVFRYLNEREDFSNAYFVAASSLSLVR
jgi:3'(2'), 5'-bisphosphate nucleotidase